MEKNKIFSKLNIKNYNNELEEILEKKMFSEEVKNLLLSMLYKIENAYKDYENIKVEVLPQNDFIKYIIKIIKEECLDIKFISPESQLEVVIDKQKGLIHCYPNEKSLLSTIWYMGEKSVAPVVKYDYTKNAVQEMIEIGSNINQAEILRDFNGWSWDIVVKEIENISYNILYQSLLLLDGKRLIYTNIDSENTESIIYQKNKKEYSEFMDILINCTFNIYKSENLSVANTIQVIREEKERELEQLKNKKEFVQKNN